MMENNISNYLQVAKMTEEEMADMYMKLDKLELVGMLINCNKLIDSISKIGGGIQPVPNASNDYRIAQLNTTTSSPISKAVYGGCSLKVSM